MVNPRTVLDAEEAEHREINKRVLPRWTVFSTAATSPLSPTRINRTDSPSISGSSRRTAGTITSKHGCYSWRSWIGEIQWVEQMARLLRLSNHIGSDAKRDRPATSPC